MYTENFTVQKLINFGISVIIIIIMSKIKVVRFNKHVSSVFANLFSITKCKEWS